MVVKEFKLGNTTIEVDDKFYPKTEEEKEMVYEEFNKIGWEILNLGKWKKVIQMKRKLDPNKIYELIGRAVTFLTTIVLLNIANYHLAIYILDNCITVYR